MKLDSIRDLMNTKTAITLSAQCSSTGTVGRGAGTEKRQGGQTYEKGTFLSDLFQPTNTTVSMLALNENIQRQSIK